MQVDPEEKIPPPVQVDPKWCALRSTARNRILTDRSIHSALKEFFPPLRTNDARADFFAIYRKESEEFDRGYAKKYDEDLNTSLIFVSRNMSARESRALNGKYIGRSVFSS